MIHAAVFDKEEIGHDEQTPQAICQHGAAVSRCPKDFRERHFRKPKKCFVLKTLSISLSYFEN